MYQIFPKQFQNSHYPFFPGVRIDFSESYNDVLFLFPVLLLSSASMFSPFFYPLASHAISSTSRHARSLLYARTLAFSFLRRRDNVFALTKFHSFGAIHLVVSFTSWFSLMFIDFFKNRFFSHLLKFYGFQTNESDQTLVFPIFGSFLLPFGFIFSNKEPLYPRVYISICIGFRG